MDTFLNDFGLWRALSFVTGARGQWEETPKNAATLGRILVKLL